MAPSPLTVVATIKPDRKAELERVLTEIGQNIKDNCYLRFPEIPTTHFARFVMIGGGSPADLNAQTRLMFSSTNDGSWEDYIDLLLTKAPHGMEAIWSACEGYPNLPPHDPNYRRRFKQFIKLHAHKPNSFYAAYKLSAPEVKACIALRDRLEDVLYQQEFAQLLDALAYVPQLKDPWAPLKKIGADVGAMVKQALLHAVQSQVTPNLATNPATDTSLSVDTRPALTDWLYTVQNEMTIVSAIKPDKLAELQRFFHILNVLIPVAFGKGELSGIATIHSARWTIIDNGRNLLFESNYDGNWEQYIGDFVDKAARNMDAIWYGTPGYPKRGARDLEGFKQVIIDHQVRAQVFYSAYPRDSLRNILNDIKLSQKLSALIGQKRIAELLARV